MDEVWSYRIEVNQAATWRERLGNWMRKQAGRIDGRSTMAIRLTTTPALDTDTRQEVFRSAVGQLSRSAGAAARLEAAELLLRRSDPQLFERDHG